MFDAFRAFKIHCWRQGKPALAITGSTVEAYLQNGMQFSWDAKDEMGRLARLYVPHRFDVENGLSMFVVTRVPVDRREMLARAIVEITSELGAVGVKEEDELYPLWWLDGQRKLRQAVGLPIPEGVVRGSAELELPL